MGGNSVEPHSRDIVAQNAHIPHQPAGFRHNRCIFGNVDAARGAGIADATGPIHVKPVPEISHRRHAAVGKHATPRATVCVGEIIETTQFNLASIGHELDASQCNP